MDQERSTDNFGSTRIRESRRPQFVRNSTGSETAFHLARPPARRPAKSQWIACVAPAPALVLLLLMGAGMNQDPNSPTNCDRRGNRSLERDGLPKDWTSKQDIKQGEFESLKIGASKNEALAWLAAVGFESGSAFLYPRICVDSLGDLESLRAHKADVDVAFQHLGTVPEIVADAGKVVANFDGESVVALEVAASPGSGVARALQGTTRRAELLAKLRELLDQGAITMISGSYIGDLVSLRFRNPSGTDLAELRARSGWTANKGEALVFPSGRHDVISVDFGFVGDRLVEIRVHYAPPAGWLEQKKNELRQKPRTEE